MKQDNNSYDKKVVISRNYDMKSIMVQHSTPPQRYYRFVVAVLKPFYRVSVWFRRSGREHYVREVAERFGRRFHKPSDNFWNNQHLVESDVNNFQNQPTNVKQPTVIWCHAVSLAGTNSISSVLQQLLVEGHRIWITNSTHTGFAQTKQLFAKEIESGQVQHSFVPVDSPKVIQHFLNYVRPQLALFVETELLANTLYYCAKNNIVTLLVQAYLSEKSFAKYDRSYTLSRGMMANIGWILAQDSDSAKRFRILGADNRKISVIGSLKWSAAASAATRIIDKQAIKASIGNRPVWVAASTHEGEESVVLSTHQKLILRSKDNPLLILVPRNSQRFDAVASHIEESRLTYARRSSKQPITEDTNVYLADSVTELPFWYELASVAFVGGSMVNVGGHNPIEALNQNTRVIMGRFTHALSGIVDSLIQQGGLHQLDVQYEHVKGNALDKEIQIMLSKQMSKQLLAWLSDRALMQQVTEQGQQWITDEQQAMDYQLKMITQVISDLPMK